MIRITGTRTGRLRAKVEPTEGPSWEVTIGGEKWRDLDADLRERILRRAGFYVAALRTQLEAAK